MYTLVHWRFFSETCGTVSIIPIYCILHLHSRIALCLSFLQENLEMMYLQFSPFYKDLNIWKSRFLAPLTPLSYMYHCWSDLPDCLIGVYTIKHCLRGQHWMGFSFFLSRFTNAKQIWGLGSNSQHWQWMQSDAITWMSLA